MRFVEEAESSQAIADFSINFVGVQKRLLACWNLFTLLYHPRAFYKEL